jgi:ribosomal protein S18 acetylase RimI-like enzyme
MGRATSRWSERRLYDRGAATLVASWDAYARGALAARVERLPGVSAAVFPSGPEREIYNNALLGRGLRPRERAAALARMEHSYAAAAVDRFAAWVHESDQPMVGDLEARGYRLEETTRAMGMGLEELPRIELDVFRPAWIDYVAYLERSGVAPGVLSGASPDEFELVAARQDGHAVATALAFDHAGDCGIYNVSTLEPHRRRGLGTGVTVQLLHDARTRGCVTDSLQASTMAESLYAALGFRDLGRVLEYVPDRTAVARSQVPRSPSR